MIFSITVGAIVFLFLLCPMKSGKIGKFRFVRVEYKSDPPDMWFANMAPIEEEK